MENNYQSLRFEIIFCVYFSSNSIEFLFDAQFKANNDDENDANMNNMDTEEKKQSDDDKLNEFEIDCNDLNECKEQSLIITDIKYFEKSNIISVSFNKSSKIYLFELDSENEEKPNLKLLTFVDLLQNNNNFHNLYDVLFDDHGNLVVLSCCKEDKKLYLTLNIYIVSKIDNKYCIESTKNNLIIEMIQKQMKEISVKMENIEIIPSYMSLLRDWEIGGKKTKKIKETEERNKIVNNDESNLNAKKTTTNNIKTSIGKVEEPPPKKRKLIDDDGNNDNTTSK